MPFWSYFANLIVNTVTTDDHPTLVIPMAKNTAGIPVPFGWDTANGGLSVVITGAVVGSAACGVPGAAAPVQAAQIGGATAGGLLAAATVGAHGGLIVEGVTGGVALPVSSTTLATEATLALLKNPTHSEAVTPSDATAVAYRRLICVTAGTASVKLSADAAATAFPMTAGQVIDADFVRVMVATTGTYVGMW